MQVSTRASFLRDMQTKDIYKHELTGNTLLVTVEAYTIEKQGFKTQLKLKNEQINSVQVKRMLCLHNFQPGHPWQGSYG